MFPSASVYIPPGVVVDNVRGYVSDGYVLRTEVYIYIHLDMYIYIYIHIRGYVGYITGMKNPSRVGLRFRLEAIHTYTHTRAKCFLLSRVLRVLPQ